MWCVYRVTQILTKLGVLHFSIIQRWCIAPHLSKHLEQEDKTFNFSFFKWEEKEGDPCSKLVSKEQ